LVMRELEGRSYSEIAEILETSVSAVETLLFRARRALREQLEGALTCEEAERAISRQADGRLSRPERSALRAHLRECKECERFARSQRAHKQAFKALALVPLPTSLTSLLGGGGAVVGGGVALKAAALVSAGVVATGVGYDGAKQLVQPSRQDEAAAPAEIAAVLPVRADAPVRRGPVARSSAATGKAKAGEPRGRGNRVGQIGREAKPVPPGRVKKQGPAARNARAVRPAQISKAEHRAAKAKQKHVLPGRAKIANPKPNEGSGLKRRGPKPRRLP
ncbi:MAG TPA: sigma factor-like helix-turn-helix DNA-binding protein, partial [Gaiellaceae bacterium]|nr:sigma factor-like helix-turn-helix DNA-binding protein [Gaiellaceae bacterium]